MPINQVVIGDKITWKDPNKVSQSEGINSKICSGRVTRIEYRHEQIWVHVLPDPEIKASFRHNAQCIMGLNQILSKKK